MNSFIRHARAICFTLGFVAAVLGSTVTATAKVVPVEVVVARVESQSEAVDDASVELLAEAITADGETLARDIKLPGVSAPGTMTIGLDDRHVWRLEIVGDGLWARPAIVGIGDRSVRFDVWRMGRVSARVRVAKGETMPEEVTIRAESPEAHRGGRGSAKDLEVISFDCPLDEGSLECELPATALDLRIRARGFISVYRWGVEVLPEERLNLGQLNLRPGASVVGAVVAGEGELSPKDCVVTLEPMVAGAAATARDAQKRGASALKAEVRGDGFFHFEGVAPGAYRLRAAHPGFATVDLHPVTVVARSETTVRNPLVLQRPAELELFLEPPTDAFGKAWQVELSQRGAIPGVLDSLGTEAADLSGSQVRRGLAPGDYVVAVLDSQGARFAWEELPVEPGGTTHFLHLEVLWVEGEVTLGDEPVEGEVVFGGRNGARRIPMVSEDDGVFGGFIPEAGKWKVHIESDLLDVSREIFVDVDPGDDDTAHVPIRLPDTRLEGKVVDERGREVIGAIVKASEVESGRVVWRRSAEDGSFLFRGLAEGSVAIDATDGHVRTSDTVVLHLSEDRTNGDLELELRRRARMSGRVVSSSGPVPGAHVTVIAKQGGVEAPFARRPQAVTGPSGEFEVRVPSDADRLELVVFPPGHALTVTVLDGVPDSQIAVPVAEHGGNLVLQVPGGKRWMEDPTAASPLVVLRGVTLDSSMLYRWAALKLADQSEPSQFVVPNVSPGEYTACWFTYGAMARSLRRGGGAWHGGDCSRGFLPPYGDLTLELPDLEDE